MTLFHTKYLHDYPKNDQDVILLIGNYSVIISYLKECLFAFFISKAQISVRVHLL